MKIIFESMKEFMELGAAKADEGIMNQGEVIIKPEDSPWQEESLVIKLDDLFKIYRQLQITKTHDLYIKPIHTIAANGKILTFDGIKIYCQKISP